MVPEDLPVAEFGFPGPLRDLLVAAILDGSKTTTTGLVADYEHEGLLLPWAGQREAVVDSAGTRVAVIELTAVRVIRLADVDLAHALGEGEGYTSLAEWRAGHEGFWHSAEMRAALDDPDFTVDDDTLLVEAGGRLECDRSPGPGGTPVPVPPRGCSRGAEHALPRGAGPDDPPAWPQPEVPGLPDGPAALRLPQPLTGLSL